MSDIVQELRDYQHAHQAQIHDAASESTHGATAARYAAAADEIERLEAIIGRASALLDSVPLMDEKYGTHVERKPLFDVLSTL